MTSRQVVIMVGCAAFMLGLVLPPLAYEFGYLAGQRAADENAVYQGISQAFRQGIQLVALRDTVARLQRQMAVQAAQRLPARVRDSLRVIRWSTP